MVFELDITKFWLIIHDNGYIKYDKPLDYDFNTYYTNLNCFCCNFELNVEMFLEYKLNYVNILG